MFEMGKYISAFNELGVKEAENYRMDNSPKKIYKFIPLYDRDNAKINKRNMDTIKANQIWASKYKYLNDPFEFDAMCFDEDKIIKSGNEVEIFEGYKRYISNSFFILSFSAETKLLHPQNNMPMWAYYSNNHHGICVEYDVINPICLYPVSYEMKRGQYTSIVGNFVALALDAVAGRIYPNNVELQKYQFLMLNILCMKHNSWKNECEHRILYPDCEHLEIGKRLNVEELGIKINSIYLGKECSPRNRRKIKAIGDDLGVDVFEMYINYKSNDFGMKAKKYI